MELKLDDMIQASVRDARHARSKINETILEIGGEIGLGLNVRRNMTRVLEFKASYGQYSSIFAGDKCEVGERCIYVLFRRT